MILQIGAFLGALGTGLTTIARDVVLPTALNIGTQFTAGIVNRELNRSAENARNDAVKAALRSAANAVSPLIAPGQGPQFTGGPPTGSGFAPATLIPPGPSPANQAFPINPEFIPGGSQFQGPVLPTPNVQRSFLPLSQPSRPLRGFETQQAGLGSIARGIVSAGSRFVGPRAPIGRQMAGVAAGGIAAETALGFGLDAIVNPSVASAPGRTGGPMPDTLIPTGLPARGRFQKDASGVQVQWFFFDGANMMPIDREQARKCVKKNCIFRFDVFKGKFVQLGQRRMNPMNVRAFFRAGRRVDAGERICRKMFSEKRKQKTGTVRRKSRSKKKS